MIPRNLVILLSLVVTGGLAGSSAAQAVAPPEAEATPAAAPAVAANAPSPTAEEIVARNVAARGGLEAWRKVHSMRLSGQMDVGQGMQVPFTLLLKRPRMMRLDFLFDGQMVAQAYDGKTGWKRRPYLGRGGYELMTAEEVETAAGQSELDGPLIDYEAKGHKVEVVGQETVEGREAYKLAVTLSTGVVRHLYVDAESALEVKVDGTRTMRGQDRKMETLYRDYKTVQGLLIPHTLETKVEGAPSSNELVIEGVELNPDLADALFAPPPS